MTSALIMAGGLGTRMRPLTEDRPKPMLEVRGKPIIEHTVEALVRGGITKIFISVNYMAETIEHYFLDGGPWGADIRYLKESEALGTGGALRLLPDNIRWPVVVVNGDVLANLDYRALMDFHNQRQSPATICVNSLITPIPYGVVEEKDGAMVGYKEKPITEVLVNAGVYVLDRDAVGYAPRGAFGLPDVLVNLMAASKFSAPNVYRLPGEWRDIGNVKSLLEAQAA